MTTPRHLMEDPREARRLAEKVDAEAWIATYLRRYLPDAPRVLDVGGGPDRRSPRPQRSRPTAEAVAPGSDRVTWRCTR